MSFLALSEIIPMIEHNAPLIASALGSPMAGIALKVLGEVFDKGFKDIPSLIDTIKSSPDSESQLVEAQNQYMNYLTSKPLQSVEVNVKLQWEASNN